VFFDENSIICTRTNITIPNTMRLTLLIFSLLFSLTAFSQNWSDDVAEIFYNKCTKCHHTGGVGPFPLTTYSEASPLAAVIYDAVNLDEMPPWPPNNDYQTYSHDRSLSVSEKTTVLNWITNGALEGTAANTPPPPVYAAGSVLGNGDLELQIPTYMSKATAGADDYVCFALPSNLATTRNIKAVEIVPGNRQIVHHALIYVDPTGTSVTDTVGGDCGGPSSPTASLVMGYTPGSSPMTLPSASPLKLGIPFPANSQVVFAMHYPEGSYGEFDSTKVIFHFYPPGETGIRDVSATAVLQNWSFALPANQITDVTAQYPASGGLGLNFSLLSVFPHMHLLGQKMKVFGIDSNLDTLKLIDVPRWDFEWQDFYFYKNIQKAEIGTTLYAEATYDNTSGNINNPNSPPAWVLPGLNTTDEMLLVYMHYMLYQNGDENYNIDSLMSLGFSSITNNTFGEGLFTVYPNPTDGIVNLYSKNLSAGDVISVDIYNTQGQRVRNLLETMKLSDEELHIQWDGNNNSGYAVGSGLYFISINVNGEFSHQRVMKR